MNQPLRHGALVGEALRYNPRDYKGNSRHKNETPRGLHGLRACNVHIICWFSLKSNAKLISDYASSLQLTSTCHRFRMWVVATFRWSSSLNRLLGLSFAIVLHHALSWSPFRCSLCSVAPLLLSILWRDIDVLPISLKLSVLCSRCLFLFGGHTTCTSVSLNLVLLLGCQILICELHACNPCLSVHWLHSVVVLQTTQACSWNWDGKEDQGARRCTQVCPNYNIYV